MRLGAGLASYFCSCFSRCGSERPKRDHMLVRAPAAGDGGSDGGSRAGGLFVQEAQAEQVLEAADGERVGHRQLGQAGPEAVQATTLGEQIVDV